MVRFPNLVVLTSNLVECNACNFSRICRFNGATAPAHLDGTMPGDFGFDPLGLGTNPDRLKWYQEAELQNGRWAMMAVAGILGTSALGVGPVWYEAGKADYALPTLALLSIQFPVMGMLETKRFEGFKATGMVRKEPLPV